jgi:hypothetical protein
MEDAAAARRASGSRSDDVARLNMASGPSRTGDIEQTIVLGAHGPYRVHIIVAAGLTLAKRYVQTLIAVLLVAHRSRSRPRCVCWADDRRFR